MGRLTKLRLAGHIAHVWEELRGSLWFVPGLMAVAAVTLALVVLRIDEWLAPKWADEVGWIYSRSPGGARDLLSTVASSMITIAGLTFSILVVALQLASAQFGPRVLRNYMRDRGSQVVLGTFIATFLYCLMVMRTIGDVEGDEPRLAVSLAVVLAIASLAVLIYFLHHAAASIHAPNVISAAARELDAAIDRLYPASIGGPTPAPAAPPEESSRAELRAPSAGYVQRVDGDALVAMAEREGLLVHVLRRPGDFVLAGETILGVSPADAVSSTVAERALGAFLIGQHRTAEQDIEFSFEQLVQIALRALSPAYNDPLTAAACIERLGAALHRLLQRREPPPVRAGDDQRPRVISEAIPIATILELALTPVAEAARGSGIALRQLASSLASLADTAQTPAARVALASVTGVVLQQASTLSGSHMRGRIEAECRRTLATLQDHNAEVDALPSVAQG